MTQTVVAFPVSAGPVQVPHEPARRPLVPCTSVAIPGLAVSEKTLRKTGALMSLFKRSVAEMFGTFWLVFGGCGAAVFAAAFPTLGIGFVGVALAFGLTVLTMAFAIGHVSGCHLNPAVSVGLVVAKRFPVKDLPAYVVAQVVGANLRRGRALPDRRAARPGFAGGRNFASNGYGDHSPDHYSLAACFLIEVILTAFFLLVILGSTDERAPKGFAPIAIGLCLTLIHLISIPVTNTSVNPARSTGQAVFVHGWAISQLWMFWVAPILGASRRGGHLERILRRAAGTSPRGDVEVAKSAGAVRVESERGPEQGFQGGDISATALRPAGVMR